MAGFPGVGGGAPRHRRGGQCLAAPGPARRPGPLALPPEEHATAAAQAPTQVDAQVTAEPMGNGAGSRGAGDDLPGVWPVAWQAETKIPDGEHREGGLGKDQWPGVLPLAGHGPLTLGYPPPSRPRIRACKERRNPDPGGHNGRGRADAGTAR